jgi:hypothetical protein
MAQDKLQNTSNVTTNVTPKAGLVTDLNASSVGPEQYTYARNTVRNSKEGDLGTIGNEPSNEYCFSAPYKIIGTVQLPTDEILVFSTDNYHSEIGIGDTTLCSYRKLVNLPCLNFNESSPITGVAKNDFVKGVVAYFTDKRNPVGRLELKTLENATDCDDLLLFKKITLPCFTTERGQAGNMPNGMYSVAIAYVIDNQVFTDWYSISNRIALYSETGNNSLTVKITDIDKEFKEFALLVVGTYIDPVTKGVTKLAKQIGIYSTGTRSIQITDFINSTYLNIPIGNLVIQKKTWLTAGIIASNANYMLLADLVTRPEEDYQLKAMGIESEYVVEQVLADYYEYKGEDVGYYRDENYDFYIQGVYNSGEVTDKFYIPGRRATSSDKSGASGADVYETDKQFSDCDVTGKTPRWRVENTAGKLEKENNEFFCDRRVLGKGKMGYHESTELLPDNKFMYGDDANTPIRFHKMPDECKVPRYSKVDGKTYINILGVRFKNIPPFDNPDIVGYKITRSDRKGGNGTVVARGLMTNVRSYDDSTFNEKIYYANYPVNDLSPDQFLSSTQTVYKNGKEENFTPLTEYHKDRFTFYSPHTLFEPRYTLGTEVKIESEEIATITGQFDKVYNHPRQKLLNQFAFWLSAGVAIAEAEFEKQGLKTRTTQTQNSAMAGKAGLNATATGTAAFVITPGPLSAINFGTGQQGKGVTQSGSSTSQGGGSALFISGQAAKDAITDLLAIIASNPTNPTNWKQLKTYIKILRNIIKLVVNAGLTAGLFLVSAMRYAQETFDTIYNFTPFTDYVYQYNGIAMFDESLCIQNGNKRRRLIKPALYVPSTVVSIEGETFNNLHAEKSVFFQLNKPINDPSTKDNSRQTATQFAVCSNLDTKVTSTGSAFYATSKVINPNQYGIVGSSTPVSMHTCILEFGENTTETPILYGGDCIITRFQFQKKRQFFSQNLANTNYPDGVEYDYRKYRNIAYPRFWMDSTKYDFSELLAGDTIINKAKFSRTTSSKHNLDCKQQENKKTVALIDNAYMYLSSNCGIDFFVEADYNVDFREKQVNELPYFSKKNRDVTNIFRSDRLLEFEEFNISRAFSDLYTTEIYATQQRDDFDPSSSIPTEQPNSVIYSLPSFNLQQVDNWQYLLPANFFAFRESDFGNLTGIHKLDQDRLIFLFSKSSPYISMGRDFLELEGSGRKITIGDGGLFAQDPREIMPTDNNYAACNSPYAFSNTHLGRFYPSERQGRIISFTESLDDITRQGMSYWCKNYMPIFLYKYFPTYPQIENPIAGVGYLTVFDSFYETVYITKRDFSPKKELIKDIIWDTVDKTFKYKGLSIKLSDSTYFKDISWTLSYSPLEKAFISWHDWHPDWVIQTDNHFLTVKGEKVYKHNERFDSFCNFYEKDYPFEIEFVSNSGQQVQVARCLEYMLEVYNYKNFGRDRFHAHHENFSHLIVHNTEQMSPLLNLVHRTSNPELDIAFPMRDPVNNVSFNVLYSKEENKYRVNQFWDMVKDRGEFSTATNHLFPTDESGYRQVINPLAIDINKPEEQRKKFRHYWTKFRLIKNICKGNKFITKLYNIKKLLSQR